MEERWKKRIIIYELIRTLSFVFVIVIHVTNYYCRGYAEISRGEYWFALILDAMARVSVPCFFMMSGALLLGEKPNLDKNVRRLFRFFQSAVGVERDLLFL